MRKGRKQSYSKCKHGAVDSLSTYMVGGLVFVYCNHMKDFMCIDVPPEDNFGQKGELPNRSQL